MDKQSSNFYEDLIKGTLSQEKTASTQQDVKKVLSTFSSDQIEALAEEIDSLLVSDEKTAEEKVVSDEKNPSAAEYLYEVLQRGANIEEKLAHDAFVVAEEMMKQASLTVEDFVASYVGGEGALIEKIAGEAKSVSAQFGKPVLQVANDIIERLMQAAQ